ncbi:MAG: asparagine synthase (glutamine-hydrolyzing), partial [Chloroflexota bacterium]
MCGIAGVHNAHNTNLVENMLMKINHRGPDGWGAQETRAGTIGHRRLAIIDVAGGRQPMHTENDWIAFNGEIYNYRELHSKYLADQPLKTNSDTEIILQLFKKMGPQCVGLLDGMFAFAIHSGNELLLARDPLGIKPLYISEVNEKLYYASEIKALALISNHIREFPPGYWFHSRLGWRKYVDIAALPKLVKTIENDDDAIKHIRVTLRTAVHKRLMSDVPIGVSLSGGLDSSIVTVLAREGIQDLKSFAVGVEGSEDIRAARLAAKQIGTIHYEYVYSKDEIMRVLPKVIYNLESFDPALVRSAIANYFLARLAAEHVKVFLTGEGADELYAGYAYLNQFDDPKEL